MTIEELSDTYFGGKEALFLFFFSSCNCSFFFPVLLAYEFCVRRISIRMNLKWSFFFIYYSTSGCALSYNLMYLIMEGAIIFFCLVCVLLRCKAVELL